MEIDISMFSGLSLKIADMPDNGRSYPTGRLQKGLLLLDQGQELAEEAVGFGVPVLARGLINIFPGKVALTSTRRGSTWDITARYKLNLVEKISRAGNAIVENRQFYAAKNLSAAIIRRLPMFRRLLTTTSNKLRQKFNWETTYLDAGMTAEVRVSYTIEEETGRVTVQVDATDLPPGITGLAVMNEQGAHHFDRYRDSSGISLQAEEIGCWDRVSAEEAWFESSAHQVAFRLGQARGVKLYRGRELVDSRLAWAGFGYSFPPAIHGLQYEIKIERLT